jgi:hypothetical protein
LEGNLPIPDVAMIRYILSLLYEVLYRKLRNDNSYILKYRKPDMLTIELKYTEQKFKELELESADSKKGVLLFFFITDNKSKSDNLCNNLVATKKYSILHNVTGTDFGAFVAGTSTAIDYDLRSLLAWTAEMVQLGFSFDCEFDGWDVCGENNIQRLNERVKSAMRKG